MGRAMYVAGAIATVAGLVAVPVPVSANHNYCKTPGAEVRGTTGGDVLIGTARGDVLVGRAGEDALYGRSGIDFLCGKEGNDRIHGGTARDFIEGGQGDDVMFGGAGPDEFSPGPGDDVVEGGRGLDAIGFQDVPGPVQIDLESGTAAGDGSDLLSGVEVVYGSEFATTIVGDERDNTFVLIGSEASDTVTGNGGADTIEATGDVAPDVFDGGEGNDRIGPPAGIEAGGSPGDATRDVITGGDGDDVLAPTEYRVEMDGGTGDDLFVVGVAAVDIAGGDGVDGVAFTEAVERVEVDLGTGSVEGKATGTLRDVEDVTTAGGADVVIGHDEGNRISGGGGDDEIESLGGDDDLIGGDGHDFLDGGAGYDSCRGGETFHRCEVAERDEQRNRGPFDVIARDSTLRVLNGEPWVVLRVTMFDRWENDRLDGGVIEVHFTVAGERRDVEILRHRDGGLKAVLDGERVPEIGVTRPTRRSVELVLPAREVLDQLPEAYDWSVTTNYLEGRCVRRRGDSITLRCFDQTGTLEHSLSVA